MGSSGFALVNSGTHKGRRVHSGLRVFTPARLAVFGFIVDHGGSLGRASVSLGSLRFASVHLDAPMGRRVHSGSRGFTGAGIRVVGFIRVRVGSLMRY